MTKSPKIVNFFNPHGSFLGHQLNFALWKSLETQVSYFIK